MCHHLEQYLEYPKRRQQAWTSRTQGSAKSEQNMLTENGWESRAEGEEERELPE